MSKEKQYSAKDIQKLEPSEHARSRPGMYFGGTGKRALHYLIFEVIDRAIASAIIGRCDHIWVTLQPDNIVTIRDTDDIVPEQLATGKYMFSRSESNNGNPDHYSYLWHQKPVLSDGKWSLEKDGLHRITIMTVNAICSFMEITLRHDNFIWKRTYHEGKPHGALQKYKITDSKPDGVTVTFQPDFKILANHDFDFNVIAERCQELAYIFPNVTINLNDERTSQHHQAIFHYPDGIQTMVHDLNQGKQPLHDIVSMRDTVTYRARYNKNPYDTIVEIALQYTESDETILRGYTNTVLATEGGTHIEGFQHALIGYLNAGSGESLEWRQLSHGLTAIINVSHSDPYYESQTKFKLLNPDIFDAVLQTTYSLLVKSQLRNSIRKCLAGMDK